MKALLITLLLGGPLPAAAFDQTAYAQLLAKRVHDGHVDYAALARDRSGLDAFVGELAALGPRTLAAMPRAARLAFWLNAYNALVLRTVVDHYPIQRGTLKGLLFPADSIWQIPGAFSARRFQVAGRAVSLDDIESTIIRPEFGEPRIHMALVCAAHSCPPLRAEPYVAARLDAQLDDQAARFLGDTSRGMRVDVAARVIWMSRIFKWYGEDFAKFANGSEAQGVREFAARHVVDPAQAALLRDKTVSLRYLDYDWALNQ